MRNKVTLVAVGLVLLGVAGVFCRTAAAPGAGPTAGQPAIVLDTSGFWRMHHTFSMPVIRFDDGLRAVPPAGAEIEGWQQIVSKATAGPPTGWTAADFDDSTWYRAPAAAACRTPYLARLCLRGKFTVTDPQKARGLRLSLAYHGGAVVYINGKEIARKDIPSGAAAGGEVLATDYPLEVFVAQDGKLLVLRGNEAVLKPEAASADMLRRIEKRTRSLEVPVPPELLRAGTNVVAVELIRAPYHKVLDAQKVKQKYKTDALTDDMSWNTCELERVRLTAAGPAGVVAEAARPEGVQVWNSDPLATDFDLDFGTQAEKLRPIRLVGARNGVYSGKVVVGSTKPLRGLRAVAGELRGEAGGTIPAAQSRIRYGLRWGVARTTNEGNFETTAYAAEAKPLFALAEAPLAEFPVYEKEVGDTKPAASQVYSIGRYSLEAFHLNLPGQAAPVFGAVVPVWVTVKVPKDARPGLYKGQVTIEVGGRKLADVPLELKVADWTVPDPDNYWTWVEMVQSPDTLALEYGTELWSDRHMELIGRSLKYLGEAGSRVLYVPLIAHTNLGNAESMVRWVKRSDNRYDYDFSALEKYLAAAETNMGRPKVVCFNVWDLYLYQSGAVAYAYVGGQAQQGASKTAGRGPLVTVLDLATGKVENLSLPPYGDPASKALWKPLFDGLHALMKKRGLEKTMMLGMLTDAWASKEQVDFMRQVAGDLPWVSASHSRHDKEKALYGIADVGYQAHAFAFDPGYGSSLRGWSRTMLNACYERWGGFPVTMLSRWRSFPEYSITGNARGIGRVGADFWPVLKDRRGRKNGLVSERYPESSWRQLTLTTSVLAPGPDGPLATSQFEAIREGVQECEARIVVERALTDKAASAKLGPDLVKRCQETLQERHRAMWLGVSTLQVGPANEHAFAAWRGCYFAGVTGYRWFLGSGWQERTEKLYALAGDVERKLNAR